MEGERFELKCSTSLQYPVVWHFQQSDGTHEIFFGNKVSYAFSNMFYSTGNQSLGEYNLLIPSADGRYAGNYKCIDDEGLGTELISIQINIIDREQFSTSVLISTRYLALIASHSIIIDAANYEATQEAAIRSENSIQSISIAIPVAVCGIVIVIIVAVQKWRSKRERNGDESCPEAQHVPLFNPGSVETSKSVRTSSDSSDSSTTLEKRNDFANPPLTKNLGDSDAEKCNSNLLYQTSCQPATRFRIDSDSSTAPLIHDGGERTS
jgi:hypothetical protein